MTRIEQMDPGIKLQKQQLDEQSEAQLRAQTDTEETISLYQPKERQDLLRWQQELVDELEQLKRELRSEVFDEERGVWVKQKETKIHPITGNEYETIIPPVLNDTGIRMVERVVRPLLSRNLINSNLDEKMAYGMLRRTSDALVNNIAYYGDTYDLDFGNYDYVVRLVKNVIIPSPFRAMQGWTKRIDSTISKRLESFNESPRQQDQKQGLMTKLFGG